MQIGHRREFLKVTFFKPFVRANRGIIVCVWSIYRDIELCYCWEHANENK